MIKYCICVVTIFSFLSSHAQTFITPVDTLENTQWQTVARPPSAPDIVSCTDGDCLALRSGVFYHSTDGGDAWTSSEVDTEADISGTVGSGAGIISRERFYNFTTNSYDSIVIRKSYDNGLTFQTDTTHFTEPWGSFGQIEPQDFIQRGINSFLYTIGSFYPEDALNNNLKIRRTEDAGATWIVETPVMRGQVYVSGDTTIIGRNFDGQARIDLYDGAAFVDPATIYVDISNTNLTVGRCLPVISITTGDCCTSSPNGPPTL